MLTSSNIFYFWKEDFSFIAKEIPVYKKGSR